MSTIAVSNDHTPPATRVIQPAWVRAMHWVNAVAIVMMIMSGWQIYNASPLFKSFTFSSSVTLGGWLRGGPAWAFRRDVLVDGQRPPLSDFRFCHRPLP